MRDFRLVADRVENASLGGLLVSPSETVLTGEPVLVSFQFPETDDWLDTTAIVTRVAHGRRPGEWTRCLGLEFDDLDVASKILLHRHLAYRPPAPPCTRPGRRHDSLSVVAKLAAVVSF